MMLKRIILGLVVLSLVFRTTSAIEKLPQLKLDERGRVTGAEPAAAVVPIAAKPEFIATNPFIATDWSAVMDSVSAFMTSPGLAAKEKAVAAKEGQKLEVMRTLPLSAPQTPAPISTAAPVTLATPVPPKAPKPIATPTPMTKALEKTAAQLTAEDAARVRSDKKQFEGLLGRLNKIATEPVKPPPEKKLKCKMQVCWPICWQGPNGWVCGPNTPCEAANKKCEADVQEAQQEEEADLVQRYSEANAVKDMQRQEDGKAVPSAVKGIVLSDEFTAEQRHDMNKLLLSEAKLERKVEKQEGRDLVSILADIDA